jgi:hypothetical protein
VSLLTACIDFGDNSEQSTNGQGVQPSDLVCDDATAGEVGLSDRTICSIEIDNGYSAIIVKSDVPDPSGQEVTVVDLGGPIDSRSVTMSGLIAAANSASENSILIGLVPPIFRSVDPVCYSAEISDFAELCDIDSRSLIHTEGYGEALVAALSAADLSDAEVDLAGTSFASARWAQLTALKIGPSIRYAAIVQPFSAGLTGERLEADLEQVTRDLYSTVLLADCTSVECLASSVGGLNEGCDDDSCYPEVILADVTSMDREEILEGLMGMAPRVADNASDVHAAFKDNDAEALVTMLSQGRAAYLGLDPLGDLQLDEIDFLSAICPTLQIEDLGRRYQFCQEVPRSSLISGNGRDVLADPDRAPTAVCLIATSPDPVLGAASTRGFHFGQASHRQAVDNRMGHGDIEYAAEILERMKTEVPAEKRICPTI